MFFCMGYAGIIGIIIRIVRENIGRIFEDFMGYVGAVRGAEIGKNMRKNIGK